MKRHYKITYSLNLFIIFHKWQNPALSCDFFVCFFFSVRLWTHLYVPVFFSCQKQLLDTFSCWSRPMVVHSPGHLRLKQNKCVLPLCAIYHYLLYFWVFIPFWTQSQESRLLLSHVQWQRKNATKWLNGLMQALWSNSSWNFTTETLKWQLNPLASSGSRHLAAF